MDLLPIVTLVALLALSAFFSGAETALVASGQVRLNHLAEGGNRSASRALRLLEHPSEMLGTILVGNNLVNVGAAALATTLMGPVYATVVITLLLLIFSEITPKTLAATHPEPFAMRVALPVRVCTFLFKPLVFLTTEVTQLLMRMITGSRAGTKKRLSRHELVTAIKLGAQDGELEPSETRMTAEVLTLKDKQVSKIMIPLADVDSIPETADYDTVMREFIRSGYTRYPVYRSDKHEMIGMLLAKDLISFQEEERDWRHLVRPLMRCRADLDADELLRDMQIQRSHLAAVQDENDRIIGLVTMEDVLEEIVGEIQDEYDNEGEPIVELSPDRFLVQGHVEVDDLCKVINVDLGQRDQHIDLSRWFQLRAPDSIGKLRRVKLDDAQVVRRPRNRFEIWVKTEATEPSEES